MPSVADTAFGMIIDTANGLNRFGSEASSVSRASEAGSGVSGVPRDASGRIGVRRWLFCDSIRVVMPPPPLPMQTPARSSSIPASCQMPRFASTSDASSLASASASRAATIASMTAPSSRIASSGVMPAAAKSTVGNGAQTVDWYALQRSHSSGIGATAARPARQAFQLSGAVVPVGDTMPMPVTATRRRLMKAPAHRSAG